MDPSTHQIHKDNPPGGFQDIGPALLTLQLNVEGFSAEKRDLISSIAERQQVDIVCLQETHIDDDVTIRLLL